MPVGCIVAVPVVSQTWKQCQIQREVASFLIPFRYITLSPWDRVPGRARSPLAAPISTFIGNRHYQARVNYMIVRERQEGERERERRRRSPLFIHVNKRGGSTGLTKPSSKAVHDGLPFLGVPLFSYLCVRVACSGRVSALVVATQDAPKRE